MTKLYNKMKYFEDVEGISAQIYYHYTTLDALYNIVINKSFRLTSLKSSNDKRELFYKPEQFLSDFEEVYNKEKNKDVKEYFNLVKRSVEDNYDKFLKGCKEKRFPYALCLSEKKDNLTHWDRYASGCTGVCIGFNTAALSVYLQRRASLAFGIVKSIFVCKFLSVNKSLCYAAFLEESFLLICGDFSKYSLISNRRCLVLQSL